MTKRPQTKFVWGLLVFEQRQNGPASHGGWGRPFEGMGSKCPGGGGTVRLWAMPLPWGKEQAETSHVFPVRASSGTHEIRACIAPPQTLVTLRAEELLGKRGRMFNPCYNLGSRRFRRNFKQDQYERRNHSDAG